MEQKNLVIDPAAVMSHFCWAHTDALLKKMVSLDNEDRIFKCGMQSATFKEAQHLKSSSEVTEIASSVIGEIVTQIHLDSEYLFRSLHPSDIESILRITEEFLEAFKKTQYSEADLKAELAEIHYASLSSFESAENIIKLLREKYRIL